MTSCSGQFQPSAGPTCPQQAGFALLAGCRRLLLALLLWTAHAEAQSPTWTERETRLANEYLSLLIRQPDQTRILDLLWDLYASHQATDLLVENIATQAAAQAHPSVHLIHSHLLRKKGQLQAAADILQSILTRHPDHPLALRAAADLALQQDLTEPAITHLQALANQSQTLADPHQAAQIHLELGDLHARLEATDAATQAWQKAASLQPGDLPFIQQIAQRLLQSGAFPAATDLLQALAENAEPGDQIRAWLDLSRLHAHLEAFTPADAALQRALGTLHFRDPQHENVLRQRIRLHERFNRLEDLQQQLTAQTEDTRSADLERAWHQLAIFYQTTVQPDRQLAALNELRTLAPDHQPYTRQWLNGALDLGHIDDAIQTLDQLLSRQPAELSLILLRCDADLRRSQPAEAQNRLNQWLDLAPADTAPAQIQSILTFSRQRHLHSITERILQLLHQNQPHNPDLLLDLVTHLRTHQKEKQAAELLEQFIARAPNAAEQQNRRQLISHFYLSQGQPGRALAQARQMVLHPQAGRDDWLRLADLLSEQSQLAEAFAALHNVWALSTTEAQRFEADDRLLQLYPRQLAKFNQTSSFTFSTHLRLPDRYTGKGFNQTSQPAPDTADLPSDPEAPGLPPAESLLQSIIETGLKQAATPAERIRSAWWSLRSGQLPTAYQALQPLILPPASPADLSVEAQQLLLEIAHLDRNHILVKRQLQLLMDTDPSNEILYTLRLAELSLETEVHVDSLPNAIRHPESRPAVAEEAISILQQALQLHPKEESLLSALSRLHLVRRDLPAAMQVWQQAAARSRGAAAIPWLERLAELQLEHQLLAESIQTFLAILGNESEITRRREQFQRLLDRLCAPEKDGRELPEDLLTKRLDDLASALQQSVHRQPFEPFYSEALAQVHLRAQRPAAAFTSMKRAYYSAPDTPFSLDQLRDTALSVGDEAQAIYFQKQILAAAPVSEVPAETRRLIELLEQQFLIDEADTIRHRLEQRYSQDIIALRDLAEHYQSTGQQAAELRVKQQILSVRPRDTRARLDLALLHLRLADPGSATALFEQLLRDIPPPEKAPESLQTKNLPLPLTTQRSPGGNAAASDVAEWLDTTTPLAVDDREQILAHLRSPRPEWSELPDHPPHQRLRAIEELSRIHHRRGGSHWNSWRQQWQQKAESAPIEALWALMAEERSPAIPALIDRLLPTAADDIIDHFARSWLLLRNHQIPALTGLYEKGDSINSAMLPFLLHTLINALIDAPDYRFTQTDIADLIACPLFTPATLDEIGRRMADRQFFGHALQLGEAVRQLNPRLGPAYSLRLASLAETAEDWQQMRHYLHQALSQPSPPGRYQGVYDPYFAGLSSLARSARSGAERHTLLQHSWQQLSRAQPSDLTTLRRAAVAALAGATPLAGDQLEQWMRRDLLTNRSYGQRPGGLMSQGSSLSFEAPQTQTFWEDTREISAIFSQQGLSHLSHQTEQRLLQSWGNLQLGGRPGHDFDLRCAHLIHQLKRMPHTQRIQTVKNFLAPLHQSHESTVEFISELGAKMEAAGLHRIALHLFSQLPERAPTNSDYAVWLLRSSENALEIEPGKSFALQLINAVPPYKPPTPGDETLREIHARFLSMDQDLDSLRRYAFPPHQPPILPGRLPPKTAYLRAYALLAEKLGQAADAQPAWADYDECFNLHEDDGLEPSIESTLHRARYLISKGDPDAALALLSAFPPSLKPTRLDEEALLLSASLHCELQARPTPQETTQTLSASPELRELMRFTVTHHHTEIVTRLADLLHRHGFEQDAMSLLIQAERAAIADASRLRLHLQQLQLLSSQSQPRPASVISTRIHALFQKPIQDPEHSSQLLATLQAIANRPQLPPAPWVSALLAQCQSGPNPTLAAAALAFWFPHLTPEQVELLFTTWQTHARKERDRSSITHAAGQLLRLQQPQLALRAARLAAELPTARRQNRQPIILVDIHHALEDRAALHELFSSLLHLPSPGGHQPALWAEAFTRCGHHGLAHELLQAALTHARATDSLSADLAKSWVQHLISQKKLAACETFLIEHDFLLTHDSAALWFQLYQAWDQISRLPAMAARLNLPTGIQREIHFLVSTHQP